eukprot:g11979.t1
MELREVHRKRAPPDWKKVERKEVRSWSRDEVTAWLVVFRRHHPSAIFDILALSCPGEELLKKTPEELEEVAGPSGHILYHELKAIELMQQNAQMKKILRGLIKECQKTVKRLEDLQADRAELVQQQDILIARVAELERVNQDKEEKLCQANQVCETLRQENEQLRAQHGGMQIEVKSTGQSRSRAESREKGSVTDKKHVVESNGSHSHSHDRKQFAVARAKRRSHQVARSSLASRWFPCWGGVDQTTDSLLGSHLENSSVSPEILVQETKGGIVSTLVWGFFNIFSSAPAPGAAGRTDARTARSKKGTAADKLKKKRREDRKRNKDDDDLLAKSISAASAFLQAEGETEEAFYAHRHHDDDGPVEAGSDSEEEGRPRRRRSRSRNERSFKHEDEVDENGVDDSVR